MRLLCGHRAVTLASIDRDYSLVNRNMSLFASTCAVTLQCVAMCCSVLQCAAAVCCSVLQCVAVCCNVLQCAAMCCSVLQQCVAVCCCSVQRTMSPDLQ